MSEALRLKLRAWRYRLSRDGRPIRFMLRHLQPGDTAVDIGAWRGAYTYWMVKAVGAEGRVVCFEPQPAMISYLRKIKDTLHLDALDVVPFALSSRRGDRSLSVPGEGPNPAGTLETGLIGSAHLIYLVGATTLDTHFASGTPVKLIKCDVEGHEYEVFLGGGRVLREQRPILMVEREEASHPRHATRDLFHYLQELDYVGAFFSTRGLRPLSDFDPIRHGDQASAEYANQFVFRARETLTGAARSPRPDGR
jgi:FkbM family methyltransferase